ncbi:DUF11 domain-containing protein, partial [Litorilinea aerophila]
NTYRWQLDSLAPQAGGSITLVAQVASGLQPGSQVANTVEIAAKEELILANNISTAWFQVMEEPGNTSPPADVAVSLWVEPTSGPAGSTVTYTIAYSNVGELAATDVVITDVIPVSLTVSQVYTSGAPLVDTSSGNTYRWQLDSLAPQAGGSITLVAQVASGLQPGSQVANTVEIAASQEISLANNISTAWFQVTDQPGSAVYLPLIQRGTE